MRGGVTAQAALWLLAALWVMTSLCLLTPGTAQAATEPVYAPPASWVRVAETPSAVTNGDGAATKVLLNDRQTRLTDDGQEFYSAVATQVLTPEGLASVGDIKLDWDPRTDTLVIHRLRLIRGATVIDLLAEGRRFTVLRRETNLERSMLDGRLTATLQVEGLRVGDILEIAATSRRQDPVLEGHIDDWSSISRSGVTGRMRLRYLWSTARPPRWVALKGLEAMKLQHGADGDELVFDARNLSAPRPPAGAPLRYQRIGAMQISTYADWQDASRLMAPLYAKAATITPGSALDQELARIRRQSHDPKTRANAAFRLVESQIRYFYLGIDAGGYVPADAETTWSRRFADCKGKTALLLAVLHGLDIPAEAALVSTELGDGLETSLPGISQFDHVIVRAEVAGKVYWLDATRPDDPNIDAPAPPTYRWALPVRPQGAGLEALPLLAYSEPNLTRSIDIDASAGFDGVAKVRLEDAASSDLAQFYRQRVGGLNSADAQTIMRQYWSSAENWAEPDKLSFVVDPDTGRTHMILEGTAHLHWHQSGDYWSYYLPDSNFPTADMPKRDPDSDQTAPYEISFPYFTHTRLRMVLPAAGSRFSVSGGSIDTVLAGHAFHRNVSIDGNVAIMDKTSRTLAPEVPISERIAADSALTNLTGYGVDLHIDRSASAEAAAKGQTGLSAPGALVGAMPKSLKPGAAAGGVVAPSWRIKPRSEDIAAAYPEFARSVGLPGEAVLRCRVDVTGAARDCAATSESPMGAGFGAAALQLAKVMQFNPKTVDGKPVDGAEVSVPVTFRIPSASPGMGGQIRADAVWATRPTASQLAAARPAAVTSSAAAIFLCVAGPDGELGDCVLQKEIPPAAGVGAAARSLLGAFTLDMTRTHAWPGAPVTAPVVWEAARR